MIRTPQGLLVLTAAIIFGGCDCTSPRGKPWRHEPDTESLAAAEPRSAALERDQDVSEVLAARDHTLRIHMEAEPRGLNPLLAPSVWARRITMGTVYETLIRYEPPKGGAGSGPGRYAPGLARSWKISPDGRELRFTLEPGVEFHDGRNLTSIDVQYTLDVIRDPRNDVDHLRDMLASVTSVELVAGAPREVKIVLSRPDGWVLRALAEIPILSRGVHEGNLAAGGRIIGTGPWQLASWKDGTVHLTRFGGYWGKAPAIDDLEFVYEQDAARALMEAKRGAFDIVPELIPAHWPKQALAPGIATAFAALELRPPRLRYLAFRCTQAPLDDARVRHAFALLIDRDKLVETAYHGLARPVMGPVWPGGLGDGPTPPLPGQDRVDQAAKLLAEAGWVDSDGDGVRDRGGERLHVIAVLLERPDPPPGEPRVDPVREALIDPLKRAGIAVEVREGTEAVVMNRVRSGDFGLSLLEVAQPVDTDLAPLVGSGGGRNHGGCGSRRIDAVLDEMRAAWEPAARVPLIAELASALAETWPLAGVVTPAPQGLVSKRVRGVVVWDGWIDLRRLSLAE